MSRQLYIPKLGDCVRLAEPWSFTLHVESRNTPLWKSLQIPMPPGMWGWRFPDKAEMESDGLYQRYMADPTVTVEVGALDYPNGRIVYNVTIAKKVTLPVGTLLRMDRIYIRKNAEYYDSVTFVIQECSLIKKGNPRFWVKLKDANKMVLEDDTVVIKKKAADKPTSYYVTALRLTNSLVPGLDAKQPDVHPVIRTSKMGDDAFLKKMYKEFGKENIILISKAEGSPAVARYSWNFVSGTPLVDNPAVNDKARDAKHEYEKKVETFYKEQARLIEETYPDLLRVLRSHPQFRRTLQVMTYTLKQFEQSYVDSSSQYQRTIQRMTP